MQRRQIKFPGVTVHTDNKLKNKPNQNATKKKQSFLESQFRQ